MFIYQLYVDFMDNMVDFLLTSKLQKQICEEQ